VTEVSRSPAIVENFLGSEMPFLSALQNTVRRDAAGEVNKFVSTLPQFHIGVQPSLDADESIRALSQNVHDAAQAMTQRASSSHQQLIGMDQVVLAMDSIRQATAQNTDGMQRIHQEAQNLYVVGSTLKELTEQYRIAAPEAA
jgi:methyl-accepting chemotaxis protein